MKELKKLLFVFLAAVFFIGLFMICDRYAEEVRDEFAGSISPSLIGKSAAPQDAEIKAASVGDLSVESMVQSLVSEDYSADAVICAAGDILIQSSQLDMAYDSETGTFDFSDCFKYMAPIFNESDYTAATLKTTLAGSGGGYSSDFAGYGNADGYSNSPEILADNMAQAGIDLVNCATNHAMDSGATGAASTIDFLESAGVRHVGTAKVSSDSKDYETDLGGIRVAFTGCTNTSNASISEDESYYVRTLENYDRSKLLEFCDHISQLKASSELVVVMLNFGNVDSAEIDVEQQAAADQIANAGADIITGTGSRYLKPIEILTVTSDSGQIRNVPVLYGMGALLSSEYYSASETDVDISALVKIHLSRNGGDEAHIKALEVIPIYANWYDYQVQPVPVCEAHDTDHFSEVLDEEDMSRVNSAFDTVIDHLTGDAELTYTYEDFSYLIPVQTNGQ